MPRSIALAMLAALVLIACAGERVVRPPAPSPTATPRSTIGGAATAAPTSQATGSTTTAVVELEKGGSFTIALRPDKAPQTVARFASKARSGFYNGLVFHRVEDWVVQGGDPTGTGSGGERVPSEYNDLTFTLGAVGIARGNDPAFNNDSQWFVVKKDSTFLDKQYTNFGTVTSGIDLVQKIAKGDKIKTIQVK
jgi:cyclophilin family peptidyl-prolyl cis-trans isomerase